MSASVRGAGAGIGAEGEAIDLLGIDAELSADERDVQQAVRAYCARRLAPSMAQWFENGAIPELRAITRELGELGVLGMHLRGYGCAGASAVEYGVACAELEACDSAIRSLVSVQGSLAMFAIREFGSEDQRQRWLPSMAAGETIGCFALTEPDHGSDPASMRTRARRDSGDWVISGRKAWITNGSVADVAVVWARTDDGIRGFVVPTDTPGVHATDVEHKLSLRASVTSEIAFDDVRLPADAQLPAARGLSAALSCLNEARYGIAWGAAGVARAALRAALSYAGTRVQFGKPIAAFQLTQAKLVEMATKANVAALVALHLGRRKDAVGLAPEQVSFGKLHNVGAALDVCRNARTVLGANGISLEFSVIRHLANLEAVLTYEGTAEMHTLVIGQTLTGIPAYR